MTPREVIPAEISEEVEAEVSTALHKMVDDVRRYEAFNAESPWRPISTAPKGVVDMLIFCPPYREKYSDAFNVFHARRDGEDFFVPAPGSTCGNWEQLMIVPTHWMPLPEPPEGY